MVLDFTEIGSPWIVGMVENDQELRIDELLNDIDDPISVEEFEDVMLKYGINYSVLPQYLKDKIDEIDLY